MGQKQPSRNEFDTDRLAGAPVWFQVSIKMCEKKREGEGESMRFTVFFHLLLHSAVVNKIVLHGATLSFIYVYHNLER
jgi:hypothetical protein